MKFLAVHPGASFSTADVYSGLIPAFQRLGVDIWKVALDARILRSGQWLHWLWKKQYESFPEPNPADVMYHAGQGILERALRQQVDWVVIFSAMYLHPDWLVLLRRAGIRTAVILTESPYDDIPHQRIAPYVDVLWTNDRASLDALRTLNPHTYYLPTGYDATRHYPAPYDGPTTVKRHDVVFVGTGFRERIDLLQGVNWEGIDLGLYGTWSMLGSRSKLRQYVRGGNLDNTVTTLLYRRARIGLNLYRTSMGFGHHVEHVRVAESMNPRAYELAACGLFHLSEGRPEVQEKFGNLVPIFASSSELEQQIRHYLGCSEARQRVAEALPECVRGDSYDARAQQVLADLAKAEAGPAEWQSAGLEV
jgi:spore maturation protein CgeB